jgi:hypothetical protein
MEEPPRRVLWLGERGAPGCAEDIVLIVAEDLVVVEADLAARRLGCPRCGSGCSAGRASPSPGRSAWLEVSGGCGRGAAAVWGTRQRMCCCRIRVWFVGSIRLR